MSSFAFTTIFFLTLPVNRFVKKTPYSVDLKHTTIYILSCSVIQDRSTDTAISTFSNKGRPIFYYSSIFSVVNSSSLTIFVGGQLKLVSQCKNVSVYTAPLSMVACKDGGLLRKIPVLSVVGLTGQH